MAKMHTVAHFTCDIPGASPEEMKQAEQLMRDDAYVAAFLAMANTLATLHATNAGVTLPMTITGTINTVSHEA